MINLYQKIIKPFKKKIAIDILLVNIITIIIFSLIYHFILTPSHFSNPENHKTYIDTLYLTFVTHSTLGYGDIYPTTVYSKICVIIQLFIVLMTYSLYSA